MGTPAQRLASDRATYPGMQVDEILVWKAWLQLNQGSYDRFDYNVHVGPGVDPGPSVAEPYRTNAIQLSQARLDAVGWQAGSPTIFEVERYAKARSVGQLLTYRSLWEQSTLSPATPAIALVAAGYDPNIIPAVEEHGIDLYTVPIDFSSLAPARLRS